MNADELKAVLTGLLPTAQFEDGRQWLNVLPEPGEWKPFSRQLRLCADLDFDYLFCLTCVDWKTHLGMVYHLTSTTKRHSVAVKIKLDRDNPEIETVSHIWRTAEFHEREQHELFGVRFLNHPDLRPLLLTEDWKGWPLRKDFEDPVNLIKL